MTRRVIAIALALLLAAPLAACGKKGKPEGFEDSTYPQTYPRS